MLFSYIEPFLILWNIVRPDIISAVVIYSAVARAWRSSRDISVTSRLGECNVLHRPTPDINLPIGS